MSSEPMKMLSRCDHVRWTSIQIVMTMSAVDSFFCHPETSSRKYAMNLDVSMFWSWTWTPQVHWCTVWVKKNPPTLRTCGNFSKTVRNYFTCLLRVQIYARLRIFIQLSATLTKLCGAILSVTTQFISCAQNVHYRPKRTLAFSDIFPKKLGIFNPNFTHLLNVHRYARIQIFTQLSPTVMKLCRVKCDHPACVSVDGGHFEHIMVVALNIA